MPTWLTGLIPLLLDAAARILDRALPARREAVRPPLEPVVVPPPPAPERDAIRAEVEAELRRREEQLAAGVYPKEGGS